MFTIPKTELVEFTVFNILGKEIYSHERRLNAGEQLVSFDFESMKSPSSGIHFLTIRAGNQIRTQKLMYLK